MAALSRAPASGGSKRTAVWNSAGQWLERLRRRSARVFWPSGEQERRGVRQGGGAVAPPCLDQGGPQLSVAQSQEEQRRG